MMSAPVMNPPVVNPPVTVERMLENMWQIYIRFTFDSAFFHTIVPCSRNIWKRLEHIWFVLLRTHNGHIWSMWQTLARNPSLGHFLPCISFAFINEALTCRCCNHGCPERKERGSQVIGKVIGQLSWVECFGQKTHFSHAEYWFS